MKNQSFYQSILQNSILVIKVSGKICDHQGSIDNVISDIKELLSSISKLKVVLVFGFGRQLDNYMINVHGIEPKKINGRRVTSPTDIEAAKKISGQILIDIFSLSSRYNIRNFPIPISKKDFIAAKRRDVVDDIDYGQVGDVVSVDALQIKNLFKEHDMIIMPSLVLDKNTSEVLNVNADTIATELAINLSASKLIFISDVPFINLAILPSSASSIAANSIRVTDKLKLPSIENFIELIPRHTPPKVSIFGRRYLVFFDETSLNFLFCSIIQMQLNFLQQLHFDQV